MQVSRLQGHLTNTKQNSTSATQQNEQSIYQIQTAAELLESGKLRANSSRSIPVAFLIGTLCCWFVGVEQSSISWQYVSCRQLKWQLKTLLTYLHMYLLTCLICRSASYSSASSNSASDWLIPLPQRLKYKQIFNSHDPTHKGFLTGTSCQYIRMSMKSVSAGPSFSPLSLHFPVFCSFLLFPFLIGFNYFLFLSILFLSTRIVPLRFQAGGRRKRPNLGLVFCVFFVCIP